ncbi:hypothetical protein [Rhizobium sp. RU36D]|uniref:hypothetical protein n=1 Tax=Rhizobium sp. RU36D TaxID=1907415 RepID=UPI0009D8DAA7|nr:hypothetical protein [Rhizobium sp. RU36D]SMC60463.1 hypothetical protein SAMN05880593_103184 [Rhizobium sp. RU36D]
MTNHFAKLGIAAAMALTAVFGSVSTAAADGIGFGIYVDGPGWDRRGPGWDGPRRGWDDRGRGPGWDGPRHGACAPGHAVEKARWNGLRRAHVRDISPRRVVIGGLRHGYPDRMVFANVRGCPLLRG